MYAVHRVENKYCRPLYSIITVHLESHFIVRVIEVRLIHIDQIIPRSVPPANLHLVQTMTGAENRLNVVEAKGLEYILFCLAPDAGISLDSFPTLRSLSSSASAEAGITQSQSGLLGKVTEASIEVSIAYGCEQ